GAADRRREEPAPERRPAAHDETIRAGHRGARERPGTEDGHLGVGHPPREVDGPQDPRILDVAERVAPVGGRDVQRAPHHGVKYSPERVEPQRLKEFRIRSELLCGFVVRNPERTYTSSARRIMA